MAYYNANLVIGLTRKALGITQEKLSEDVCAVETYSRIENGHHTVRKSTYQKLMKKMGRIAETRYTVCVAEDGVLLENIVELRRALKRYDYEAAEKYLLGIKKEADDNLLTRQYIERMEALVDYHRGKIDAKELIIRLNNALAITAPDYKKYMDDGKVFPFVKQELLIMMNMGNIYRRMGNLEEGLKIYEFVIQCLETNYMGEPDNTTLQITVRNGISMVYESEGNNQEALKEIEICLKMASKTDYGHLMAVLLSAKAYNIVKLVEKKALGEEYMNEAKNLSRQAYFLAAARGDSEAVKYIIEFYTKNFGKWKEL